MYDISKQVGLIIEAEEEAEELKSKVGILKNQILQCN